MRCKSSKESGEFDQTARRHAKYLQNQLERASADTAALSVAGRLSAESALIDEVRAAIDWAFSAKGDVEAGVTLTIACLPLWTHFSLNGECLRYVEQALLAGRASHGWNDRREMQLLAALGALLIYAKGPGPEADAAWTKALKIAEAVGDADYQVRALWGLWSSHFQQRQVPDVAEPCGKDARGGGKRRGYGSCARRRAKRWDDAILSWRPYQWTTSYGIHASQICQAERSVTHHPISI